MDAVANHVQGQGLVWGTTKTHQRREVPIPRFLAAELAEHVKGKKPDDLVFAGIRNGQPLRVSTFRTSFSAGATAIGVPDLHPHQLRHTAASSSRTGSTRSGRMDRPAKPPARAAPTSGLLPRTILLMPQCCPRAFRPEMTKRPLPAFPLVRTPFRLYPRPDSNRRYRRERAAC